MSDPFIEREKKVKEERKEKKIYGDIGEKIDTYTHVHIYVRSLSFSQLANQHNINQINK